MEFPVGTIFHAGKSIVLKVTAAVGTQRTLFPVSESSFGSFQMTVKQLRGEIRRGQLRLAGEG